MKPQHVEYIVPDAQKLKEIKQNLLNWLQQFSIFVLLDSNGYPDEYGRHECIAAAGAQKIFAGNDNAAILNTVSSAAGSAWLFGHLGYGLHETIEPSVPKKVGNETGFNDIAFFTPETIIRISRNTLVLTIESTTTDVRGILQLLTHPCTQVSDLLPSVSFSINTSRATYLEQLAALRRHIAGGDCYELNFCVQREAQASVLDPIQVYRALGKVSPTPFMALYRWEENWCMCASPERFIQKMNSTVIAQPIKGTAKRGQDTATDEANKIALSQSQKDRAENIMITDLMRNDLARCSTPGSVTVAELCGVYTYPQVHQMISTISAVLKEDADFESIIRATFPMGSMTGAPKVKVMQLINQYESEPRGLFSGSIGYIDPAGNFDFNVVIRSLFYNTVSGKLHFLSGGAITFDSDPAAEWEELQLKAAALAALF